MTGHNNGARLRAALATAAAAAALLAAVWAARPPTRHRHRTPERP